MCVSVCLAEDLEAINNLRLIDLGEFFSVILLFIHCEGADFKQWSKLF